MNDINNLRFILHVSDFHLNDDDKQLEEARYALEELTRTLKSKGFVIEYLIHTGDVINSGDLFDNTATEYGIPDKYWEKDDEYPNTKHFLYEEYSKDGHKSSADENTDCKTEDGQGKSTSEELDWGTENPTKQHLEAFDQKVKERVIKRFEEAEKVMRDFITDLNVAFGNVVICSGNHDVLRPLAVDQNNITCAKTVENEYEYQGDKETEAIMEPFNTFIDKLKVANSQERYGDEAPICRQFGSISWCTLDGLNILILNTNWINPKKQKPGYYCVRCNSVKKAIEECHYKNQKSNLLNVILAHKPIYEICEKVRLSYKKYTKTSFLSKLQEFAGSDGIYLCGDKHTRSIISSYFHDIPHYIGGEPILVQRGNKTEIEYNLIAVSDGKVSMERKTHLSSTDGKKWTCEIRPQDETVKKLYNQSKTYIIKNTFEAVGLNAVEPSWENLCQNICNWTEIQRNQWYDNIDELYRAICRYRNNGMPTKNELPAKGRIFSFIQDRLSGKIKSQASKNILNIRGEHSSSKSMFLGLFYIHLMMEYSLGKIDFIPAYFNLESNKIYKKIESGVSYYKAVTDVFNDFVTEVNNIAVKEYQPVCYIIDGLDELDCWSLSTEDSVGRGILNILAKYENAWYVMAFSQHNLPRFKNTMPTRMYSDTSDIMYFNPLEIKEAGSDNSHLSSFIKSFLQIRKYNPGLPVPTAEKKSILVDVEEAPLQGEKDLNPIQKEIPINEGSANNGAACELPDTLVEDICNIIRNFRRLTITPGFVYQNYDFITEVNKEKNALQHKNDSISSVYSYYIDRQNERCLEQLGYGFVNYAPAMAYYFSYKGFTYEKFMHIQRDNTLCERHELKLICENAKKIYPAFLFIKKNKEAREFLIAMHYNRELRYYAEHPNEIIEEDSILNEFITHDIAVTIRNLWTDANKFVIACEQLIQREELGNCTLSMLIYCLMHLKIYEPIRNQLQIQMRKKGKEILLKQGLWDKSLENNSSSIPDIKTILEKAWDIHGKNDADKMDRFLKLSLRHTMELYKVIDSAEDVCKKYKNIDSFWAYNSQHQMLYYGDLSNKNDANIHPLKPGVDVVYGGFDFHDCFNSLYAKILVDKKDPLHKYHLVTLCNLINCRIDEEYLGKTAVLDCNNISDTFFYRNKDKERSTDVLKQILSIIQPILKANNGKEYLFMEDCYNKIVNHQQRASEKT